MSRLRLIVGLGNPGAVYEGTRHNLGAQAVSFLMQQLKLSPKVDKQLHASLACCHQRGWVIARPLTFMNLSGQCVETLLNHYRLELEDLLVVHDDMRLEWGQQLLQFAGPARGQNGVRSIVQRIGSENFWRLRLGLSNELCHPSHSDYTSRVAGFVLSRFSSSEQAEIGSICHHASELMIDWANGRVNTTG